MATESTEEHKRILDDRLKADRENPDPERPWGEVREELLGKLRKP